MNRPARVIRAQRTFVLGLLFFATVAALVTFAVDASKTGGRKVRSATTDSAPPTAGDQLRQKAAAEKPLGTLAASITATLTDNITAATKVAPGANINYTATITNNGAVVGTDDATNLNFSAPLDANTTLVAGSVHASPIARNDTYNWVGNTQLDTAARALPAVTANDVAVNAPAGTDTIVVTAIAGGATSLGGTVTLASPSGAFTYTPPLGRPNIADGASVNDTFTYTITNSADPSLTSTGTVTITLTGRVWYLQAGAAGDGRSNTPSSSPAAMSTAADKSTDVFYIFSNAVSLNGPLSVDAGQQLLGQGVNLVVSAITLFTAAAPTPTTTNTAGNCVALAGAPGNNTLSGFNIGNCTGGTAITGANVGTLNVSTVSINTNGGALDLTGVGAPTVSVVLGGTTSTGGAKNVNLVGLNGTITLGGGTLSGATSNAFDVSGAGTAVITYSGTIGNTTARSVSVVNKNGGSVSLSGAVSGSNQGIVLTGNTGSTINFTGGISLSTGANAAFTATGGGTVTGTQDNTAIVNTLTTTTGTALNVSNTTIGASGLTFRSISVTGNNTNPTNGIILNAAGTGTLKVTGNGGACTPATPTCTGGTIQGTGSHGISLTSASNIEFNLMSIHNTGDHGIYGDGVNNFTLRDCRIFNFGNTTGAGISEDAMHFESTNTANTAAGHGLTGTVILQRDNIGPDGNFSLTPNPPLPENKGIVIRNHNDLDLNMTVTGTTFSQISNDGIDADIQDDTDNTAGHGAATITVDGSTADGANTFSQINGRGVNFQNGTDNVTARIFDLTIKNNNFDHIGIGGRWAASGRGTMNARYNNNTMTFTYNDAIRSESDAVNAALTPHASVNATISNNTMGGGSIFISLHRGALSNIAFTNNSNIGGTAAGAGGCASCLAVHTGINLRSDRGSALGIDITGNTGTADGSLAFAQSALDMQATDNGGGPSSICANIGGAGALKNTFTENPDTAGQQVISIDPANVGTSIQIEGGPGGSPGTENFLIPNNTLNGTNKVAISTPSRVPSGVGVNCVTSTPSAPVDDTVLNAAPASNPASPLTFASNAPAMFEAIAQLQGLSTLDSILSKSRNDTATSAVMLRPASEQVAATEKPVVATAAPASTSNRAAIGNVIHHAVSTLNSAAHTVDSIITPTVYAQNAVPNAPTSGEVVSLNTIATFPAGGKSITIKYSATVNTPPLARSVSTQGTVSGGNFASVLTDDPEPAGGPQATVTLVDTTMTWNGVTSTDWNTATNWTQPAGGTQYAPGVSNPAINDVVIPNVGAQPNIPVGGGDIGLYSMSIANGRTLTIDTGRTLTIGGSPGGDLTLDGIISGGFLNLGTGTHVINNAGGTGSLSSTNVVTVISGSTVTLNNNLQAGALAVNAGGSMNITNRTLSLNGAGAALTVPGGATFTTTGSTVAFNGTAAQQAAGIAYNNLTINNSIGLNVTGVTLTGNATVNGTLTLTSSDLDTGAFTLTQPNTTPTAPASVSDVVGTVTRTGGPFALSTPLTFGNPSNILTITAGATRPTAVTMGIAKAAPVNPNGYAAAVQRTYTISQTGGSGFTSTLRLHYLDSELNGNTPEASLNLWRLKTSDNHWTAHLPTTVDSINNWVESTGVLDTELSTRWTMSTFSPTASNGVVTGRITDAEGRPVEGAVVRLSGDQNRKFITDGNGNYRFDNVETGGFYTLTPSRANFNFNPFNRSFSQTGNQTEAVFTATSMGDNANPLDTPEYFVRQQYVDILSREPDEGGFNYWSDQINQCLGSGVGGQESVPPALAGRSSSAAQQSTADCISARRRDVAAAFFIEQEAQQTGSYIYDAYTSALGRQPVFNEYKSDRQQVVGGATLDAEKAAFALNFVQRAEFTTKYQSNTAAESFVDALIQNAQNSAGPGVDFSGQRDALIAAYNSGGSVNGGRALVVQALADNAAFKQSQYNAAFVLTEYFSYLRRDAEPEGYNFWLNVLNFGDVNNYRGMVCSFITSAEYQKRFSNVVSHNNTECAR